MYPVSYTHLDVYKRQSFRSLRASSEAPARFSNVFKYYMKLCLFLLGCCFCVWFLTACFLFCLWFRMQCCTGILLFTIFCGLFFSVFFIYVRVMNLLSSVFVAFFGFCVWVCWLLIYKLNCTECNKFYIGQTERRIKQK